MRIGAVEGSGIVLIVLALALVSRKKKAVSVKGSEFFLHVGDLLFSKIPIVPHHPPAKQYIFFLRACANVMYHQRRTVAGETI